jgi:glycogen phosphorylase
VTPPQLRSALNALSSNLRWSWNPRTAAIFSGIAETVGAAHTAGGDRHPVQVVAALDDQQLSELASDDLLVATVAEQLAELEGELATAVESPEIVYYSPEFGISELVPQYSGGLGILAGDHVKAASDIGLSLGAVGLFYREGFFRQDVHGGEQIERYETYEPAGLGCVDTGVVVDVPIGDRLVAAVVWRMAVGRIPLLLLDTDLGRNSRDDRKITDRLYSGDRRHRLEQELVLGVGGARAVAALGWTPGVHHLNEGHAGFIGFELLDRELTDGAPTIAAAVTDIRPHVLFTTHTPVPAGIDRFDRALIEPHLRPWSERWEARVSELLELGRDPEEGLDVFNMAALCLRIAEGANGVSKLHGEVSRELFAAVPGGERITSVTNGVHARTWVDPLRQELFDEVLGTGWANGDDDAWSWASSLDPERLRSVRRSTRAPLAELVRERTGATIDPDALVIGFARRFATYKRATLLLRHPEALAELLADDDRPVHLVFAGKAHPADGLGKELLAEVVAHGGSAAANGRFTFVPDYDMAVARAMYAGCDVWLNTPVRPHEASGTSGEKAALNGVLNCSIRDGWWAEMSDGRNGWDIALSTSTDPEQRDDEESATTLSLLGTIAAEFHADGRGEPSDEWLQRMCHAWATLGPQVTSARMVRDYDRLLYAPMLAATR